MERPIRAALQTLSAMVVFVLFASHSALAQSTVEQELAGIRSALNEIASLMRVQARSQSTEILLRQIEIKSARLTPVAAELRTARSSLADAEQEVARLRVLEEELSQQSLGDNEREIEAKRQERVHLVLAISDSEARHSQLQQRVFELEDEQRRLSQDIESLETRVEELMEPER